ncbi:hypothetical protein Taro_020073 [Colocasia esculenta]|uniref:Ubiquitin-like protease family profile domain-containing protein n=1 Tax=Colocasia esculenta TaxID=4460 RepID=A0A843UMQ3_COLES|nr:hypothetical protein [Colocasia esculenta]
MKKQEEEEETEEEDQRKRKEEEDEQRKKKEQEEDQRKKKDEEDEDDKSKEQHFDYAFGKLDRAPNEFDLLFSPMHVGTNHWALLVIHIKEKEFHVYDSLRNKLRRDIPQYVEELKRYLKGKHIDAEKWPLCYPDPCPQQGSEDDCGIFTCKYMECLARRGIQDFPFSQDDMPYVRAKFALHFIKAYFNAQERS